MKIEFDIFVLPFTLGLTALILIVIYKFSLWIKKLPKTNKSRIIKNIFTFKSIGAIKEIITESLFHRRIFKVNPVLGYMHCTFALGWFLLILIGNIESRLHSGSDLNPPYYPIFLKFFVINKSLIPDAKFFTFIMDFVLLLILSGLVIAMTKRFYSKVVGMKKTTKMKLPDKLALTSLWFIFPFRLIAEGATSGVYHAGGFLTDNLGRLFGETLSGYLMYPSWWAYSISLGLFFISVPFSRYMHIPTEILFIALKKYGIKQSSEFNSFSEVAVNSCPRCGVCIDVCQLGTSADINNIQSVYAIRSIREGNQNEEIIKNCLMCGRCTEYCPVGIDLNNIRISQRKNFAINNNIQKSYTYINTDTPKQAEYIYFAGCMTHLTPKIKLAVTKIFDKAKLNYLFIDEDGSICCGRPLKTAGLTNKANELAEANKKLIYNSGAKILITSCPICYKMFKEDYALDIEVYHHSEFILNLVNENKIKLTTSDSKYVYHDPCELGRGSDIYEQPRDLVKKVANLVISQNEKEDSLCCGGCLNNINIKEIERNMITSDMIESLSINNPEAIITSCPLCKKTINKTAKVEVLDIAEAVAKAVQ